MPDKRVAMRTKLCETLGIEYPIIAAPMGPDLTGPELVAVLETPVDLEFSKLNFSRNRYFAVSLNVFGN
jgi:hypothetical protein